MKLIANGIDCATPLTFESAQALHSYGYNIAIRYLVPKRFSKRLTVGEVQDITDNAMRIATVYETTSTTPKGGYVAGVADAQSALDCAIELSIPADACIYFAVDYQPQSTQDMYNISNYFIGIKSIITTYKIGVYGCYDVIEWLYRQNICKCYWQCMAWSFGKISDHATMYQKTSGRVIAGVNVDLDEIYVDVGFWNYAPVKVNSVNTITAVVNGIESPLHSVLIDNENYVRLKDLADIDLTDPFTASWDTEKRQVIITTKGA